MTTSSPTASVDRLAVFVPGLDRGTQGARPAARRGRPAAGRTPPTKAVQTSVPPLVEKSQVSAPSVLVDPVEALGRERGAGRADGAEAAEVAPRSRLDPGLHAGGDVGGAGAEHRHPGALGEVPEHAHVRVARVAVVEDDRGPGQQSRDEEVPHHPAGRGEPEEAVAGVGVDVEVELLQVLEQDAALRLHDRLRQAGGAGGVEDPERVVEGDALEAELGALARGEQLVPARSRRAAGRGRARGRGRAGRRCARRLGISACSAARTSRAGRSPCRRSGSRRPRRGPWARSGRSGRSRWPGRSRASSWTRPRRCWRWRGRRRSPRGCSACRRRRGRRARPRARAGRRRPRRPGRAARPSSARRARAARRRGGSPSRRRPCRRRRARRS